MGLSLSALVALFIISPGFTVIGKMRRPKVSDELSSYLSTGSLRALALIVCSVVLIHVALLLLNTALSNLPRIPRVDLPTVGYLLSGSYDEASIRAAFQNIQESHVWIFCYFILAHVGAFILGNKLAHVYQSVGLSWFDKILDHEREVFIALNNVKDEDLLITWIVTSCYHGDDSYLISGIYIYHVNDVNNNSQLQTLVLEGAQRKRMCEPDSDWQPIPGEFFTISGDVIKTINVDFLVHGADEFVVE